MYVLIIFFDKITEHLVQNDLIFFYDKNVTILLNSIWQIIKLLPINLSKIYNINGITPISIQNLLT